MENGFNIEKEIAVKDNSKIYSVLAVRFSGTKKEYPAGYEYVGELKAETDTEKLYIHKQLKRLESCFTNISALPNKQTEAEKLNLAISNITKILED
jgi:tRNA A22 N-methylase